MSIENILLVLGGEPSSKDSLCWRMEEADLAIAVDSGWLAFRAADVFPDILIGDLDSWDGDIQDIPAEVELIERKEQETTDFQKTLCHLESYQDLNKIVILGGLGRRTDHLISNFITSGKVDPKVEVLFDSESEWVRRVTPETPLEIKGQEGATVSLIPLNECRSVSSTGLKWEIKEKDFTFENISSQSNLCTTNKISVSLSQGSLLVILQK